MTSVRKSSSSKVSKPFCKVCFDSGKNPELFSSHFIKNVPGPRGIVVCPTLLALSCLKCNRRGHTVSYCTFTEKPEKPEKSAKPVLENPRTNSFSVLDTNSFSDLDTKPRNKKVPVLVPVPAPEKVTYASVTKCQESPKDKPRMKRWADESDSDNE